MAFFFFFNLKRLEDRQISCIIFYIIVIDPVRSAISVYMFTGRKLENDTKKCIKDT